MLLKFSVLVQNQFFKDYTTLSSITESYCTPLIIVVVDEPGQDFIRSCTFSVLSVVVRRFLPSTSFSSGTMVSIGELADAGYPYNAAAGRSCLLLFLLQ